MSAHSDTGGQVLRPADGARADALYAFLSAGAAAHPRLPQEWTPTWRHVLVIPGPPATKSRPLQSETSRARYKKPGDKDAERRTAGYLRAVATAHGGLLTGNVALGCVFYRPDMQWIDADNMVKHVCDAGNGVLWVDDSQVTAALGVVEYDPTHPRTLLVVGPHLSSMRRGSDDPRPRRPPRPRRARTSSRFGACADCAKPIAKALTRCAECRRTHRFSDAMGTGQQVANLDGLFSLDP